MRAAWQRVRLFARAHRAAIGYLILAIFVVLGFVSARVERADREHDTKAALVKICDYETRSWRNSVAQIHSDTQPQKPSEAVLRAFPQLRPFYDPKNPLFAEQIRALARTERRRLRVLGPQPKC